MSYPLHPENLKKSNPRLGEYIFGGTYHRQLGKAVLLGLLMKANCNSPGLMSDDFREENAEVKEAVRRLPLHLQDQRQFRIARALQLSATKTILPKEEWMKVEDVRFI
jgi:ubiquinol-cytochrome c reductase subunit 7